MEDVLKSLKGTCHYLLHSVQYGVFNKNSRVHVFLNCTRNYTIACYLTRRYYRKGSAALGPKPWGLIIPINFVYLICLIHTLHV
jgi:hypothetical protein